MTEGGISATNTPRQLLQMDEKEIQTDNKTIPAAVAASSLEFQGDKDITTASIHDKDELRLRPSSNREGEFILL